MKEKMNSRIHYEKESQRILNSIRVCQKEYGLSDFDLDVRGIMPEQYDKNRLEIGKIKNEQTRTKAEALLEVRLLKGQLTNLTSTFLEDGVGLGN